MEAVDALLSIMKPVETEVELIRLGTDNDGGYLVPNDLAGVDYCFSPGVGDSSSFEEDLAARGVQCFLADYSVDGPCATADNITFDKMFIGASDSDQSLSMDSWYAQRLGAVDKELILQMDIEGAEYSALLAMSPAMQRRCRIMAVEFHDLRKTLNPFALRIIQECMRKLLSTHYIVHAHPNNCCGHFEYGKHVAPNVLELTFLRKDRVSNVRAKRKFKHMLDQENIPGREAAPFPSVWFS
jgi:hypothetical protein